ncbi:hypothetical protein CDAR_282901 [Caerostris darwini]|uniref:Uncharacterized protein n=1 Tax=Caerostris darwini TaxID=1538125 RepID=A0AAV4W6U7_9ARAC|nr:hypothetical protein CDAR_282901 [Caerostris darwini]
MTSQRQAFRFANHLRAVRNDHSHVRRNPVFLVLERLFGAFLPPPSSHRQKAPRNFKPPEPASTMRSRGAETAHPQHLFCFLASG